MEMEILTDEAKRSPADCNGQQDYKWKEAPIFMLLKKIKFPLFKNWDFEKNY